MSVPAGLKPRTQTSEVGGLGGPPDHCLLGVVDADRGSLAARSDLYFDEAGGAVRVERAGPGARRTGVVGLPGDCEVTVEVRRYGGVRLLTVAERVRRTAGEVTAPFVRPGRTSPTLYAALASPSSSHTTTASPEAETATSGLWCWPVVCEAVTSQARVVGPVYPAALTVAGVPVWMSSHTTVKATAPPEGAPSGSTATRGLICWPVSAGVGATGRCDGPSGVHDPVGDVVVAVAVRVVLPRPRRRCPCRPGRRPGAGAASW